MTLPSNPVGSQQFRPNSLGYYATMAAFFILGGLAAAEATIDHHNSVIWLIVASISCIAAFALMSTRLVVAPDQVVISCLGASRVFPATQIDSRRFDDLVFLGFFQLALRDGQFVLVPRFAFADTAIFSAIKAASARAHASNSSSPRSRDQS